MAFKIYDPAEEPRDVYFRLVEDFDGAITLAACDSTGNKISRGNILSIEKNGMVSLHSSINPKTGLALTADGTVVVN